MNFDGDNAPLAKPSNNCSNNPEPGTPGFDAWQRAEAANRAKFGSGINAQRLATIAKDKKAVEESKAKQGE